MSCRRIRTRDSPECIITLLFQIIYSGSAVACDRGCKRVAHNAHSFTPSPREREREINNKNHKNQDKTGTPKPNPPQSEHAEGELRSALLSHATDFGAFALQPPSPQRRSLYSPRRRPIFGPPLLSETSSNGMKKRLPPPSGTTIVAPTLKTGTLCSTYACPT